MFVLLFFLLMSGHTAPLICYFLVELALIYLLTLSFNPLFLVFVFVGYLLSFSVSLIFLLGSYYYSYIIYLLFFSGLLVMFMYVCSIICNEKIYFNFDFFIFVILFLGFFLSYFLESGHCMISESLGLMFYEFCSLLKFFVFSFNALSVFFVFYLFFCLIVVYEAIKKNSGPLRMK